MSNLHYRQTSNHRLESWVYANSSERGAASGFSVSDVGRVAFQQSDSSYWRLHSSSPVSWVQVGSGGTAGGGVSQFTALVDTPSSFAGQSGNYLQVGTAETSLEFVSGGGGAWTSLTDTPGSYSGQGGKLVQVGTAEAGLVFGSAAPSTFIGLTDTPSSFAGAGNAWMRVNSGASALIYATPSFTDLSDSPASYSGHSTKYIAVKTDESGLEFVGVSGATGSSFLASTVGTPSSMDDEFDSGSLDVKWTAVQGSSGTINLLQTSSTAIYDLTTRSDAICFQAGPTSGNYVYLRQDYTLPSTYSIVAALAPAWPLDASMAANEMQFGITLNSTDSSPQSGDYAYLFADSQTLACHIRYYDNTNLGYTPTQGVNMGITYLRIARSGLNYYGFTSFDGRAWTYLGKKTVSSQFTNVWIISACKYTNTSVVPVGTMYWIRQGGNGLDPWVW